MSVPKGEKVYAQLSINDGGVGVTSQPGSTTSPDVSASVPVSNANTASNTSNPGGTNNTNTGVTNNAENSSIGSLRGLFGLGSSNTENNQTASTQTPAASTPIAVAVEDNTPAQTAAAKPSTSDDIAKTGYTVNSLGYTTMPDGTIRYVGTKGNTVVSSSDQKKETAAKNTTTPKKPSSDAPKMTSTTITTPVQGTTVTIDDDNTSSQATPANKGKSGLGGAEIQWNGIHTGIDALDDAVSTAIAVPIALAQSVSGK